MSGDCSKGKGFVEDDAPVIKWCSRSEST